jgi:hypothetical protein
MQKKDCRNSKYITRIVDNVGLDKIKLINYLLYIFQIYVKFCKIAINSLFIY